MIEGQRAVSRSRKFIYLSLTGVLLIAALLGAALYVSSDALLNSPWVHQRVTVALSRATGGAVAYDRLRLVWMPVPRAEFGGVSVSFDGSTIRVDRVTVEPALRLLLHGELRIRGIRLQQPRLNIVLPEGESPFDPRKIESTLRPVFRTLSAIAPDLQMEIRGGFINLVNFWKTPQTRDYRAAFDGLEATLSPVADDDRQCPLCIVSVGGAGASGDFRLSSRTAHDRAGGGSCRSQQPAEFLGLP